MASPSDIFIITNDNLNYIHSSMNLIHGINYTLRIVSLKLIPIPEKETHKLPRSLYLDLYISSTFVEGGSTSTTYQEKVEKLEEKVKNNIFSIPHPFTFYIKLKATDGIFIGSSEYHNRASLNYKSGIVNSLKFYTMNSIDNENTTPIWEEYILPSSYNWKLNLILSKT